MISSVLIVLALVLVLFGTAAVMHKCRKRRAGRTKIEVNDKSSSDHFIYNFIFFHVIASLKSDYSAASCEYIINFC